MRRRAEVAEFQLEFTLVDQNVVGLDVGVKDRAFLEQFQREQQLLRVGSHRLDVQADVLAVLLQHFSQIHAATSPNYAELFSFGNFL